MKEFFQIYFKFLRFAFLALLGVVAAMAFALLLAYTGKYFFGKFGVFAGLVLFAIFGGGAVFAYQEKTWNDYEREQEKEQLEREAERAKADELARYRQEKLLERRFG